jgi:hypothetical protein
MRNKLALVTILFLSAVSAGLIPKAASAQATLGSDTAKRLVGTWRLMSTTADGKMDPNRGPKPTGLIHYDAKGYMSVQIMPDRVRPKFAGTQPTPDEAKAAMAGYTAYFGTYTIDEKARTVTHRRTGNINPGGMGDFVRRYEFAPGDRLILRPVENKNALTWERIK